MKKKIIVAAVGVAVAIMGMCAIVFLPIEKAQATENVTETQGHGDGHCTQCGLRNGHYRCPAFCPVSASRPTVCKCGHDKNSHAYRR